MDVLKPCAEIKICLKIRQIGDGWFGGEIGREVAELETFWGWRLKYLEISGGYCDIEIASRFDFFQVSYSHFSIFMKRMKTIDMEWSLIIEMTFVIIYAFFRFNGEENNFKRKGRENF